MLVGDISKTRELGLFSLQERIIGEQVILLPLLLRQDLLLDFFDLFLKLLDLVAQLQVLLVRLVQDGLFLFVLGLKSPDNLPLHDQFLLDFI